MQRNTLKLRNSVDSDLYFKFERQAFATFTLYVTEMLFFPHMHIIYRYQKFSTQHKILFYQLFISSILVLKKGFQVCENFECENTYRKDQKKRY